MKNPNVQYLPFGNFEAAEQRGWHGAGWYFWNEAGQYCYGPYDSEGLAELALKEYGEQILGLDDDE